MENMKVSELLDKAAEVASKLEHCKGVYVHHESAKVVACCTIGAIRIAGNYYRLAEPFGPLRDAEVFVCKVLPKMMSPRYQGIGHWNDDPNIGKEDVVTILKLAATKARDEGK